MQTSPQPTDAAPFAPEIVRQVGDVSRPRVPVKASRALGHLPGESGTLAGLRNIIGTVRHGEVHCSASAAKHGPLFRHMVGFDPAVYVADPDAIWSVLRNEDGTFSTALGWGSFFFPLASRTRIEVVAVWSSVVPG